MSEKIEEMAFKIKEVEEKAKEIESTASRYKNSLSDQSIQILEKEGIINKLNEEITVLKSGSKVDELVFYYLLIERLELLKKSKS